MKELKALAHDGTRTRAPPPPPPPYSGRSSTTGSSSCGNENHLILRMFSPTRCSMPAPKRLGASLPHLHVSVHESWAVHKVNAGEGPLQAGGHLSEQVGLQAGCNVSDKAGPAGGRAVKAKGATGGPGQGAPMAPKCSMSRAVQDQCRIALLQQHLASP